MAASRVLSAAALRVARTPAAARFAGLLERIDRRAARALTVLTYHRVDEPSARSQLDPALLSATPAEFERQIEHVAARWHALSLPELLAIRRGQAEAPPRGVLVTFDDAYRDFAEHAWPVLSRYGVPATLFVPTAYAADRTLRFWWDRLHAAFACSAHSAVTTSLGTIALGSAAERLEAHRRVSHEVGARPHADAMRLVDEVVDVLGPVDPGDFVLPWDELRALASEGVALAAHTRTHPRLDRIGPDDLADEVRGSLADLERETGAAPAAFAYPQGGHSDAVVAALERAGVEVAFTTARGVNDASRPDWIRLRRVNVGRRSSVGAIRLQILAGARFARGSCHMTAAPARIAPGFVAGAGATAAAVGAAATYQPALTLAALLALAAGIVMARWPEAAVLAVVALVWLNLPALGVKEYGVPRTVGALFPALLAFPVALRIAAGRRFTVDRPLLLLLVLLAVQLVGTALSAHVGEALDNTLTFAIEGVVIYALVLNSIERFDLLRRALWVILGAATFMSSVAIFQALTGSWLDPFGGFGQVNPGYLRNPEGTARAAGPIGDPNYFAQILLPAAVVGFIAFRREPRALRLVAAGATWIVVAGIALTYSRGALLALLWLLVAMVVLGYARMRWLVAVAMIVPLLATVVPAYQERVASVTSAITGATQEKGSDRQADVATQGRVGEIRTAAYVFADHPILGVGPGVFPLYYQDYAEKHGIEAHNRSFVEGRLGEQPPRQAHSMPVAIAADLGLVGLIIVTWLFAAALGALAHVWRRARLDLSDAAGAILLGVGSYLVAGIFLTLAFERYLWLLLALGGAAVQLAASERRRKSTTRSS